MSRLNMKTLGVQCKEGGGDELFKSKSSLIIKSGLLAADN